MYTIVPEYRNGYLSIDDVAPLERGSRKTLTEWAQTGRIATAEDLALVLAGTTSNISKFNTVGEWRAAIPITQTLVDAITRGPAPFALVEAARHIRANMAHYSTTDYTETAVIDVFVGAEHIDAAVLQSNTAESNARTTTFPGPEGSGYMIALDHHHANASRPVRCGRNTECGAGAASEGCAICPGQEATRRFPDDSVCLGLGSDTCGGWSARVIWVAPEVGPEDELEGGGPVKIERVPILNISQTYGPAAGQILMIFVMNLPAGYDNTQIRVTFRAPRAGPVVTWISHEFAPEVGRALREFARDRVFGVAEKERALLAPVTLDYVFGLTENEIRDFVIRVVRAYPLGDAPGRTTPALSAVRGAMVRAIAAAGDVPVSDEIAYVSRRQDLVAGLSTALTPSDLMAVLSPRDEVSRELTRLAVKSGDGRRSRDLMQAAAFVRDQYNGRWLFDRSDVDPPPELRPASVRSVIRQVMLGAVAEDNDAVISNSKDLIAEVPIFDPRRASDILRSRLNTFNKMLAAHDVLTESERLAVRYRRDLFMPIPLDEIFGAWEPILDRIFESAREGFLTLDSEKVGRPRWAFVGPGPYFVAGTPAQRQSGDVEIAFLARPEFGARYFNVLQIGLGQRFKGELLPPVAFGGNRTVTIAAQATASLPVRKIAVHAISDEAEWPFQVARRVLTDSQWKWLTDRARIMNGILISERGARAAGVVPVVRRVADVFALAGINVASEAAILETVTKADEVLPTLDPNEPKIVPGGAIAVAVGALAGSAGAVEIEARIDDVYPRAFYALVENSVAWYSGVSYAESSVTYFTSDEASKSTREEVDNSGNRRLVAKTERLKLFDPFAGVRFAVATEEEIAVAGDSPTPTMKRVRKRWSMQDNGVRIDATVVDTLDIVGEAVVRRGSSPSYEVELEAPDIGAVLNGAFNTILLRTIRRLFDTPLYFEVPVRSMVFSDFNSSVRRTSRVFFPSRDLIETTLPGAFRGVRRDFRSFTPVAQGKIRALRAERGGGAQDRTPWPPAMMMAVGFTAQPRNLKLRDLTYSGLGGGGRTSYAVALKADGVSAFLYVHQSGVWVLSPPLSAALVLLPENDQLEMAISEFEGCVIAGEDVPLSSRTGSAPDLGARMFAPFDLIAPPLNGRPAVDMNNYLARYSVAAKIAKALGDLDPAKLMVAVKTVAPIRGHRPEAIASAMHELRKDMPFKTDGYIFTPISVPHNPFPTGAPDLHQRVLSAYPDVCKFKPWKDLTIDLRIAYQRDGGAPVLMVTAEGRGRRPVGSSVVEKPFSPEGPPFDFVNRVDWRSDFFASALPGINVPDGAVVEFAPTAPATETERAADEPSPADPEFEVAGGDRRFVTGQEREFLVVPSDPRQISLAPRRLRLDKLRPNGETIANDVWQDIKQPLSFETVAGSTNFGLLYGQNNRLKSQIYNRAFNGGAGASWSAVLVDLGSGRGGDLSKFAKHINSGVLRAVILVEPDEQNFAELLVRISGQPEQVASRMYPLRARAEDHSEITAKLRNVLDYLYEIEAPAERVLVSMMLSLSFFFSGPAGVEALGETLFDIRRETAEPIIRRGGEDSYQIREPVALLYFTIEGRRVRELFQSRGVTELNLGPVEMTLGVADSCVGTLDETPLPTGVKLGEAVFRVKPIESFEAPPPPRSTARRKRSVAALRTRHEGCQRPVETLWVQIPGTIVRGQTEYLVDLELLEPWLVFSPPKSSLIENFLTEDERAFGGMFVYGTALVRGGLDEAHTPHALEYLRQISS